jgi:hypothetical protein
VSVVIDQEGTYQALLFEEGKKRKRAKQIAREVSLELAGQVFHTHLIVSDGQGIDVILGMSLMKLHQAILDIAKWLICLDSTVYGKVTLHILAVVRLKHPCITLLQRV